MSPLVDEILANDADLLQCDLINKVETPRLIETLSEGVAADGHKWAFRRDGFCLSTEINRPFVLEVFAGSGRLTRALRQRGLDAWAVDWRGWSAPARDAGLLPTGRH